MRLLQTLFQKAPWLTSFALFFIVLFSLAPTVAEIGLSHWISKQTQSPAHIDNIDFNIFTGSAAVHGISVENKTQKLTIETFEAKLSLSALFNQQLQFEQITLQGVHLPIHYRSQSSELSIAGFTLPLTAQNPEHDDKPQKGSWGVAINRLKVEAITFKVLLDEQPFQYQVKQLSLKHLNARNTKIARLRLNSLLNRTPIKANLQLNLFGETPKVVGTLSVSRFDLAQSQKWLPPSVQQLAGVLDLDSTFTLEQATNGLKLFQSSEIFLQDLLIKSDKQQLAHNELTWKGDTHLFLGNTKGLKLLGALSIDALSMQNQTTNIAQQLSLDLTSQIDLTAQLDPEATKFQQTGTLNLKNLRMTQGDQNLQAKQLHYQGDLVWNQTQQQLQALGLFGLQAGKFEDLQQVASGSAEAQLDLSLRLSETGPLVTQNGSINLTELAFENANLQQTIDTIQWQGALKFSKIADNKTANKQTLAAKGQLDLAAINLNLAQQQLSSSLKASLDVKVTQTPNQLQVTQTGPIQLKSLRLKTPEFSHQTQNVQWTGDLQFQQTPVSAPAGKNPNKHTLAAKGQLDLAAINLNLAQQQLSSSLKASLDVKVTQSPNQLQVTQTGPIQLKSLRLKTPEFSHQTQNVQWKGDLQFQQTPVSAPAGTFSAKQTLSAQGEVDLQAAQTSLISANGVGPLTIQHDFNSQLDLVGQLSENASRFQLSSTSALNQLRIHHPALQLQIGQLQWQNNSQVTLLPNAETKPPAITTTLDLSANQLALVATSQHPMVSKPTDLIHLEAFELKTLHMPNANHLSFQEAAVIGLKIHSITSQAPVLSWKSLQLDSSAFTRKPDLNIQLGNLHIDNLFSKITLDQDRQLQELAVLQQSLLAPIEQLEGQHSLKQAPETPPQSSAPLAYSIRGGQFTGKNTLELALQEGNRQVLQSLDIQTLQFGSLASTAPEELTPFDIQLTVNQFGQIQSQGKVAPLATPLSLETHTTIEGLSLVEYSPFVENTVGYEIQSGQLSAKINGSVNNQMIAFSNSLNLAKLDLNKASKEKSAQFDQNFQVPLNIGLNLLKDKQQNIDLKLPIKGDLSNPNFNPTDIIGTALNGALGKATRAYLLVALQPFGALALAGEFAFDKLTAIKLESIVFEPGREQLSATMQTYLKKVANLFTEKPSLQIKLCTGSSEQDRAALAQIQTKQRKTQQETSNETASKTSGKPSTQQQTLTVPNQALLQLAQRRQTLIKQFLIDQGVVAKQVILCQPAIDKAQRPPVVDMGI